MTGSESRCPLVTNYNINYNYNINSNCNISSISIDIHSSSVSGRGIQGKGGTCAENTRLHRYDKIWLWAPRVLRFVSHNAAGRRGAHGRAPTRLDVRFSRRGWRPSCSPGGATGVSRILHPGEFRITEPIPPGDREGLPAGSFVTRIVLSQRCQGERRIARQWGSLGASLLRLFRDAAGRPCVL